MFRDRYSVAGVLLLAGASACVVREPVDPPNPISLEGSWVLNVLESRYEAVEPAEDAADVSEPRSNGGGRRGRVPQASDGVGLAPGDLPISPPILQPSASARAAMQALVRGYDRLRITETDSMISLTGADSMELTVNTNGRKQKLPWAKDFMEARARWEGGFLVVERKLDSGVEVEETFDRSAGASRMVVTTKIRTAAMIERRLRRVYDLQP